MKKVVENNFPVDIVYTWVDGNDPVWIKKHSKFSTEGINKEATNGKARYTDNQELKYNLRALDRFAPWIRKIFIITDNQVPSWLDITNPKIEIVNQNEILPLESLPTFNSVIIEHHLHKIPGLSEFFLYANDDMFINKPVSKKDFFTEEGLPIVRLNRRLFRKFWVSHRLKSKKHPLDNYNLTIHKAALLAEKKFGKYIGHKPHHNIDSYRKSQYAYTREIFKDEIDKTLINHLRKDNDIQRAIYTFAPLLEGKAKKKFVGKSESFRCHIEKAHYLSDLEKIRPMFFCVNDSQFATDEDRKRVTDFLEKKFPEKSKFEK